MTTIVSAFISNVNTRPDRDLQIYVNHGLLLCYTKIIFLDEPMYKIIASTSYNKATTTLIQINANSSYLYDLLPQFFCIYYILNTKPYLIHIFTNF
jgi:hypothetical protein